MLSERLQAVRAGAPVVHSITNYVTVNDVANILLASGARPIMADAAEEMADITAVTSALYLNIGTLNSRTIDSMLLAGKEANKLGHPIVLDPVGVGASKLRTETALKLLDELDIAIVRGNISEIKGLANGQSDTQGVDANVADLITEDNLDDGVAFVKAFAKAQHTIVAATGAIDIVSDGEQAFVIRNGRAEMGDITGTGDQVSALTVAFLAANPEHALEAVTAAVAAMGVAGELGFEHGLPSDGNSTYRNHIIDAIYHLEGADLDNKAQVTEA